MGTRYEVVLDLKTVGSLNLGLTGGSGPGGRGSSLQQSLNQLRRGIHDLSFAGGKFMSVLDTAAGAAMSIAKWGAVAAGGTAFAALTYSVTNLNNEMERARIGLGAIFSARGWSNDLASGIEGARGQIAKMREDARQLPGTFQDLQKIYVTGAIGAAEAGADPERWRKTASLAMAFGQGIAGMDPHMVAREMAILLEGRSGAHNLLGMRLAGLTGEKAKTFNQSSAEDRFKFVEAELQKYQGALNLYAVSFDALSNSLIDRVKIFLTDMSGPLFQDVKKSLADINNWFDANSTLVAAWAESAGSHLSAAFNWVVARIEEWSPAVQQFFKDFWEELPRIRDAWMPLFDLVNEFAKGMLGVSGSWREALANKELISGLERILKLYLAIKTAQVGWNIASAGLHVVTGLASLKNLGALGALGSGASGIGSAALGAAPAALAAALPAALAGGLFYGAFGGNSYKGMTSQSQADWAAENGKRGDSMAASFLARVDDQFGDLSGFNAHRATDLVRNARNQDLLDTGLVDGAEESERYRAALQDAQTKLAHYSDMQSMVAQQISYLRETFQFAAADALELAWQLRDAGAAAVAFAAALSGWEARNNVSPIDRNGMTLNPGQNENYTDALQRWMLPITDEVNKPKATAPSKHPGGKGGTTVQKVEIVVTSNQHPSRIARTVVDEIQKLDRNVRVSRHVPSWLKR